MSALPRACPRSSVTDVREGEDSQDSGAGPTRNIRFRDPARLRWKTAMGTEPPDGVWPKAAGQLSAVNEGKGHSLRLERCLGLTRSAHSVRGLRQRQRARWDHAGATAARGDATRQHRATARLSEEMAGAVASWLNPFRRWETLFASPSGRCRTCSGSVRYAHHDARALARDVLNAHRAAVLFDDLFYCRKTQPGAQMLFGAQF